MHIRKFLLHFLYRQNSPVSCSANEGSFTEFDSFVEFSFAIDLIETD